MKRAGFLFIVLIYTHNILGQGFFEGSDIISKTYSQRWELDSIDKKELLDWFLISRFM